MWVSDTGMCLGVGLTKLKILGRLDTDTKRSIFGHRHLDTTIKYIYF